MTKQASLLIVDDEKNTREGLARALGDRYRIQLAADGEQALDILSTHPVDVMLSDIRMPGMSGITLMQRALTHDPPPICILLTAYGSIETAVEAMKRGAYDFLTKPVNLDELEILLERALKSQRMEQENRELRAQLDDKFAIENIIGESAAMQPVFDAIRQVSPTRATVLVEGESGTGKELVAHAIHRYSPRRQGPFVAVHCAALSSSLLESELFGHEKGAFTGAVARRKGRFEKADGGSLFLDEIGEIDPSVQVKILRVLEERRFERVGGQETVEVDVRLITATNRDLKKMVEEGRFREDLYYRLHVVAIHVPPLRERATDIPLLASYFLRTFTEENNKPITGFTPDCMDHMTAYRWPGNVRELRNVVESMVVMARGEKLTVRDLPSALRENVIDKEESALPPACSLDRAEKQLIAQALKAHNGNRTRAAEQLGISRRTLHRKINQYKLRDNE